MRTMASTTHPIADPKPGVTPLPTVHRIGLGLGVAALLIGCCVAVAFPQERVIFLILLAVSIVAFATTLTLTVLRQHPATGEPTPPESKPQPKPAPAVATIAPAPKIPMPDPVGTAANPDGAVQASPGLDVAALMQAPLASLLLAALLKNPEETRRLFGQPDLADLKRINDSGTSRSPSASATS